MIDHHPAVMQETNGPSEELEIATAGHYAERTARFRPWRNPISLASAALFITGTLLAFLSSAAFFLLFIPALLLSALGLRGYHAGQPGGVRILAGTGSVLVFNGVVLILALFVVGLIHDFLEVRTTGVEEAVALAFTTVHFLLGIGLLLLDLRHGEA